MKNRILNLSTSRAATMMGLAFVTSVIIVTIVDDYLLPNFVIPGDTVVLAKDIEADTRRFYFAIVGYLFVLVLDSIIAVALYVVLKPANKDLAAVTAILRLLYAFTVMVGLSALAFHIMDVNGYAFLKLVAYIFFALHIQVLGYSVFKSGYLPKSLGILLILAAFTYIVFYVELNLPEILLTAVMLTMALAELSLSIWLIIKRNELPENIQ